ncbi:MAG: MFS transporter [Campylobacterota bacterium]|nr:MFS transporter [Campylobacterota bacterium]
MQRYLELLKQEKVLARLSTIQLIAYFGAWFSNVAIYTLLLDLGVSASVIAITAALHFLPGVLQAPFSGVLIDRFHPKKMMLVMLIIEIVATFSLIFITDISEMILLFFLIVVRMGASSFYFTLEMALLPKILHVKKLQLANEIHSIIWSISYTLGMAISGFVVYKVGVKIAFILDAMLFVIAFLMLIGLSIDVKQNPQHEKVFAMLLDTFTYIKRDAKVFYLLILHAIVGFTAFDALVALMVNEYYSHIIATSLAIGMLHASRALGLVIGPVIIGKYVNNKNLAYLFWFQAIAVIIWGMVMKDFYLSLMASLLVGLCTTTLWSYTYTILQHHTDEKYYGRVVAYNDMLFLLTAALISMLIGWLAELNFSLDVITYILGSLFIFGALYYHWLYGNFELKEIDGTSKNPK